MQLLQQSPISLLSGSSNQLLSPECWKVTLRVLGCLPPSRSSKSKAEQPSASSYRSPISLSPQQVTVDAAVDSNLPACWWLSCSICYVALIQQCCDILQVDETIDWLSDYFLRSRLSKPDLRSFGLYSAWTPYISDVVSFWEHLIGSLINVQLSGCARESVGSSKIMKGNYWLADYKERGTCKILLPVLWKWNVSFLYTALQNLHSKLVKLFKPWIFPLDTGDGGWVWHNMFPHNWLWRR